MTTHRPKTVDEDGSSETLTWGSPRITFHISDPPHSIPRPNPHRHINSMPSSSWIQSLKSDLRISKRKHGDHPVKVTVKEVGERHDSEELSTTDSTSSSPQSTSSFSETGYTTKLPEPLHPASLLLQQGETAVAAAQLPENLGVTAIPTEAPPSVIDAQDAYVARSFMVLS